MEYGEYCSHLEDIARLLEEKGNCCDRPNPQMKEGNWVCVECGTIYGRQLVDVQERFFSQDEKMSKKFHERKSKQSGKRTNISSDNHDARGNSLSPKKIRHFNRQRKIQNSLIGSLERNYSQALYHWNQLSEKLNLPPYIKEDAWNIYIRVAKKKLTSGRTIRGFIAASIYAAIRIAKFPIILDEVSTISMVNRKMLHKDLGLILREVFPLIGYKYEPVTSESLVCKFGAQLNVSGNLQIKAVELIRKAMNNGLRNSGKDPKGFASAALYIEGKKSGDTTETKTQEELAEIASITPVTLRTRVKELKRFTKT